MFSLCNVIIVLQLEGILLISNTSHRLKHLILQLNNTIATTNKDVGGWERNSFKREEADNKAEEDPEMKQKKDLAQALFGNARQHMHKVSQFICSLAEKGVNESRRFINVCFYILYKMDTYDNFVSLET